MRRLLVLLVVLGVLFGLFLFADRKAAEVAEGRIAEQIQRSQQLSSRPAVEVSGFPFLLQALRGRYSRIDVGLQDPAVQDGLTIDTLDVQLRGVRIKLLQAAAGDVSSIPVDSATAVATVSYAALNAAVRENLPDRNSTLRFAEGDAGRLRVTGSYRSPVLTAKIDTEAELVAQDGGLVVRLPRGALDNLPELLRPQVSRLIADASQLPELPYGFQARSVSVGPRAVRIDAAALDLELLG